jgi:hypothetical protein
MAKIADLLVQLTVDTASLRRDFNSAQKTVENFGSGLNTAFRGIASAVGLSIGAISAHMAVDFVKSTNAAVDSLGKLSQKIGISVQDLSTMQHALKLSDVPVETFATGVGLLSKSLAGMSDELETKGAPAALQALGIKARDAAGNIRSTSDVLLDIAEKFKGFADGAGKTNLALQLFGRSGKELIPFLNEGADGIRRLQEEAKSLGLEIDGKTSVAAQQFNDDLERLKAISEGTARQFLSGLLPSLNRLAEGFTDVAKQSDIAGESLSKRLGQNVGEHLESLTKKFLGFGFAINEAKTWLDLQNQKFLEFTGLADKGDQSVAELAQELHNLRAGWEEVNGAMTKTVSISQQLFGNDSEFAKGIEALNKQFPVPKAQPPNLPDAAALAKAAAAAKKYAEDYKRAFDEIRKTTDSEILSAASDLDEPFIKVRQKLREDTDKITEDLAKFPELATKGPQRIGGLVVAAISDSLKAIDKIGDEAKKKIDEILGKSGELEAGLKNVPIITPQTAPTLSAKGQLENYLDEQLKAIAAQDLFNRKIDEFLLRTGSARDGVKVFFREYARYATDTAQVFHDAFAKVFGALEDQLTNLLAHFKFDFKSFLDTIKESIARATVQKLILGPIAGSLSKLGGVFGKIGAAISGPPDGSKDKPFFVNVVNGIAPGVPGVPGAAPATGTGETADPTGGIIGKIQGVFGKIFSSIGSFFSKFGSIIGSIFKSIIGAIGGAFGGGHADGGPVIPSKFYLVGERGPELFAPNSAGTIIPNHQLGGSQHTSNNIVNNFYLSPVRSDPFGYSQSQLANAVFTGNMRAMSRA